MLTFKWSRHIKVGRAWNTSGAAVPPRPPRHNPGMRPVETVRPHSACPTPPCDIHPSFEKFDRALPASIDFDLTTRGVHMAIDFTDQILAEYDSRTSIYDQFSARVKQIIDDLPELRDLRILGVYRRFKQRDSLEAKLRAAAGEYQTLDDITDIAGVRIVTFFEEDIDEVAGLIKNVFEIDYQRSVDKRAQLQPDRFGYRSLHYIALLTDQRLALNENRDFGGYTVEIQIRSILQHAWAEIEHKLGYKSKESVPPHIRRMFYRLAGVLELSDEEFNKIRRSIEEYSQDVSLQITTYPESVGIDAVSLANLVAYSSEIAEIEGAISFSFGIDRGGEGDHVDFSKSATILSHLGYTDIAMVMKDLVLYKRQIINFTGKAFPSDTSRDFPRGASVASLAWYIALQGNDRQARDAVMTIIPDRSRALAYVKLLRSIKEAADSLG
jgi:ppGpp synthetase/RelA/SpoT-type nucleotidyltranferase